MPYYYSNKNLNFNKLNDDQLLIEFKNYLVEQKFTFKSKNLNELNDLTASFKKMAGYKNVISKLNNLKTEIEEIQKSEIDNNKIDILAQLKSELASRYLGTEARNEELLKNDNQFQFAFELTKNNDLYNKLLHNK